MKYLGLVLLLALVSLPVGCGGRVSTQDAFLPIDGGPTPDAPIASDGGVDAASTLDVGTADSGAHDAGHDAAMRDVGMDAFGARDAFVGPDAFVPRDAFVGPDAYVPPIPGAPHVAIAGAAAVTGSAAVTLQLDPPNNLVTNGGFESHIDGWMATTGGDGWGEGGSALFEAHAITGSYVNETLTQRVDLLAAGITAAEIDARTTPISIWQFYSSGGFAVDRYELIIRYLDAGGATLAMTDTGTLTTMLPAGNWNVAGQSNVTYPVGTRFIELAITQTDTEFWAGFYGAVLDGSSVTFGDWEVSLSNDGTTWSAYQPYTPTTPWTLTTGSGERTVYVQFRLVGTTETYEASDTITAR